MPQELTTSEVAILLGCSRRTIQRLARAGKLPSRQIGKRLLAFDPADIAWIIAEKGPRTHARRRGPEASSRKEPASCPP